MPILVSAHSRFETLAKNISVKMTEVFSLSAEATIAVCKTGSY
nr:hypothetical protein [uncultured Pedobacter sp.]